MRIAPGYDTQRWNCKAEKPHVIHRHGLSRSTCTMLQSPCPDERFLVTLERKVIETLRSLKRGLELHIYTQSIQHESTQKRANHGVTFVPRNQCGNTMARETLISFHLISRSKTFRGKVWKLTNVSQPIAQYETKLCWGNSVNKRLSGAEMSG